MLDSFLRALLLGFSIAAPVGPIGVLCIRRTLALGRAHGFVSGLGAATADATYGLIGGLGLSVVSSFLVSQGNWLRLVGGLFLCYLGVRTFLSKPAEASATTTVTSSSLAASYGSTVLLTLTNPATILSFAAMFAGLNVTATGASVLPLVAGVFCGSALWWLMLAGVTGLVRHRLSPTAMTWINRISGAIVTLFGLLALIGLIR